MTLARCLIAAIALTIAVAVPIAAAAEREISVAVVRFEGPGELSAGVTTILQLQIWQTLRAQAPENSGAGALGAGTVKTGEARLPRLSHATAEAFGRHARVLSQLVLWGTVQPYGNGAVVQAFLSAPLYGRLNERFYADFRTEQLEVWTVHLLVDGELVAFIQDMPRRRLSFEPIVLSAEAIDWYSRPDAWTLYDVNDPDRPIGKAGERISGIEQRPGGALVKSGGLVGVLRLPALSKQRSEVVDFVSALVRIFRGDWQGARELFALVVERNQAPTELRIDAYLYRAMANARLGKSGYDDIAAARALNPYSVRVWRFAIMDKLAELSRLLEREVPAARSSALVEEIKALIDAGRPLFLREDPWLAYVLRQVRRIATAN